MVTKAKFAKVEFGANTCPVCSNRLPTDPTYDAEIVCCVPSPCSNAAFHCSVYGALRLGSKPWKPAVAMLAAEIEGGCNCGEADVNDP